MTRSSGLKDPPATEPASEGDPGHLSLELVAALDEERGIGRDGDLPWQIPADMAHFKRLTTRAPQGRKNAVIMGRRTWESIPSRFRPLRNRLNVVLSRDLTVADPQVIVSRTFTAALDAIPDSAELNRVFVIGGASVYAAALELPDTRWLHLTRVEGSHDCDVFFPVFEGFVLRQSSDEFQEGGEKFRFETWEKS